MKFLFLYLAFFVCVFGLNAQNTISIEIPGTNTDISSQTHEVELTNSDPIDVLFDKKNLFMVNQKFDITDKIIVLIDEKIDSFIEEFFYKLDGCASERIGNAIVNLLKNR